MLRLLYGSLIQYLQDHGFVAAKDFDAVACNDATLKDISPQKVRWFIEKARAERSYALAPNTPRKEALAHLNLLAKGKPTRGAILLFNESPERFIRSADVTCLHFHGTAIAKPIPSQQVYHGSLFDVVDKAVDFVMDRLHRSVKPSDESAASDVRYEVPFRVVREAIVNAVAHRNYASKFGHSRRIWLSDIYRTYAPRTQSCRGSRMAQMAHLIPVNEDITGQRNASQTPHCSYRGSGKGAKHVPNVPPEDQ